MKFNLIFFFSLLFSCLENYGQVVPLKSSPFFGQDIIIHNAPDTNQGSARICSAPNGWLYSEFAFEDMDHFQNYWTCRSVDNGLTWQSLGGYYTGIVASKMRDLEVLSIGNDPSNQKLFISRIADVLDNPEWPQCVFNRLNANTLEFELYFSAIELERIKDFSLASDFDFPSTGSNPHSVAALFCVDADFADTLVFMYSPDGGDTFIWKKIHTTTKEIVKVSLAFGRSPSKNSGRYYVAWQEVENNEDYGHIYTSHSEPNFNSPFTKPVCLDSLDPSAINNARNPVISCQFSGEDNDSLNFTELVLFEKNIPSENRITLDGFYNRRAATSNTFTLTEINPSNHYLINADVAFNPWDSFFYLTFYDSTDRKLPLLKTDMNNPSSWETITQEYNDDNNFNNPAPDVEISRSEHMPVLSWITRKNNNVAVFDSYNSTYNGINKIKGDKDFLIYPNPCEGTSTIEFINQKEEEILISVYDLKGLKVYLKNENIKSGKNLFNLNLSTLSKGIYIVVLDFGNQQLRKKITIF